ncbi:hypothetical protein [Burkholderia ubonensis]|uniref:hypothetical protein n=1 Tax=Burkholderia ubonensis TaxID=101571 RepID=UPI002AB0B4F7|nr:hypothetical protein [Burkholderia ubonensis]
MLIANFRNPGGAGGAEEASQTPQFQAYADKVSETAYEYCARKATKLGGQVSSDVIDGRKWQSLKSAVNSELLR